MEREKHSNSRCACSRVSCSSSAAEYRETCGRGRVFPGVNPSWSQADTFANQVAQEAWQYERHLMSEMRCNEFVGKDGKGSHHLGTFSDTHYRLNSLRTREDSRTQMYDPQRQWQQLVQTLQRSRWRIAVYLLRLSQQKVMREERERQKWDQEQRAKREKDREQRVDEWIACEKRRWRQARPDICGRYHAHDKW